MFGTPLPFSRTPRGTIALEWAQVDGRTTYEVDLAPNNDEASAKIASIYRLDEFEVGELLTHTQDVEFPKNTPMVIYQLGGMSNTILNPTHPEGTALEIAAKFWIIAENITEEVSEIFHIEIPNSYDNILCTRYPKDSKKYKELSKKLLL